MAPEPSDHPPAATDGWDWPSLVRRAAVIGALVLLLRAFVIGGDVDVTVEMRSQAGSDGQMFWNDGAGYHPDHSTLFPIKTNGSWQSYRITGGPGPWKQLRLDPGSASGSIALRRIEIRAGWTTTALGIQELRNTLGGVNGIALLPGGPDELVLQLQGPDPFFDFSLPPGTAQEDVLSRIGSAFVWAIASSLIWVVLELFFTWLRRRSRRDAKARRAAHELYFGPFAAFALSFLLLGACLTFAQPLFSVPDELTHWEQSHIDIEHWLSSRDCVPTLTTNPRNPRGLPPPRPSIPSGALACGEPVNGYSDAFAYPGVIASKLFLPNQTQSSVRQIQGLALARILQGLMVLGCLLRLGVLAWRAGRVGAVLLMAFVVTPLVAQQAFAVSADGVQLSTGIMMGAMILYWEELRWWDLAIMLSLGWGAAAKPFLIPCFIPSAIAGFCFARMRSLPPAGVGQAFMSMFRALVGRTSRRIETWLLWASVLLTSTPLIHNGIKLIGARHRPGATRGTGKIHSLDQLKLLLEHPLHTLDLDIPDFIEPWRLHNLVGPLGWLDTGMSRAVGNGYGRVLALACLLELSFLLVWAHSLSWKSGLRNLLRATVPAVIGLTGALGSVAVVALVLYMTETTLGANVIEGLQTRYFVPAWFVALGSICGAASVVFVPDSMGPAVTSDEPAVSTRSRTFVGVTIVLTALVFSATLPLVTRVFVDLAKRYG
ncbi:MAG: DUF2142 domain-containing protein [Myxococcales bacterium]